MVLIFTCRACSLRGGKDHPRGLVAKNTRGSQQWSDVLLITPFIELLQVSPTQAAQGGDTGAERTQPRFRVQLLWSREAGEVWPSPLESTFPYDV